MMDRRTFLSLLAAASAFATARAEDKPAPKVGLGPAQPFDPTVPVSIARDLASRDFVEPALVPQEWRDLTYDQYRNILFDPRSAIGSGESFEVELFAPGLYFTHGVELFAVEDGAARPIKWSKGSFTFTDQVPDLPESDALGYSGFRLRHAINKPDLMQEFAVFQGASYFRAVGRNQLYGLSARGLAIGTASNAGEEFPFFRSFWMERREDDVVLHAVLDSQSVAGAYRFVIEPGEDTIMDVTATLFPRKPIEEIGIAPLTSMFLYDGTNRTRFPDFRPAVHDSDGLLIVNGAGEHLWRKLANPKELQVSSFVDASPRGFGLMQRQRRLDDFADLEARYERRPSLWVEPEGDWGDGAIVLVEIPSEKEIYDNVVAFWRPRAPVSEPVRMTYRLHWGNDPDVVSTKARVIDTRMGENPFGEDGSVHVAIDFAEHQSIPKDLSTVTLHTSSNAVAVTEGRVKRNPETKGVRLDFSFRPNDLASAELRAQMLLDGAPISEVWMYRWTR